jgi:hypothetical protein
MPFTVSKVNGIHCTLLALEKLGGKDGAGCPALVEIDCFDVDRYRLTLMFSAVAATAHIFRMATAYILAVLHPCLLVIVETV